jgi:hypothetical protein
MAPLHCMIHTTLVDARGPKQPRAIVMPLLEIEYVLGGAWWTFDRLGMEALSFAEDDVELKLPPVDPPYGEDIGGGARRRNLPGELTLAPNPSVRSHTLPDRRILECCFVPMLWSGELVKCWLQQVVTDDAGQVRLIEAHNADHDLRIELTADSFVRLGMPRPRTLERSRLLTMKG